MQGTVSPDQDGEGKRDWQGVSSLQASVSFTVLENPGVPAPNPSALTPPHPRPELHSTQASGLPALISPPQGAGSRASPLASGPGNPGDACCQHMHASFNMGRLVAVTLQCSSQGEN